MKKALKYIIILAVSTVLTLLYGFCIGGEYTTWLAFAILAVSVLILTFFDRKPSNEKLPGRIAKIIATAALVTVFSLAIYNDVNTISSTFVDSYEAEASYAYIRKHFGHIFFKTPDGAEQEIEFNDAELSEEEEENLPYYGGKIIVAEYEGLFGVTFYRYVGPAE